MNYDTIVWDWNGTLCDDVAVCIDVMNGLLAEQGLPPIPDVETYRGLFCFPVIRYYERLGFDFAKTPFETLAHAYIAGYAAAQHRAGLCPDALDTLDALQNRGVRQAVLSAGEQNSLLAQMAPFPIASYFSDILGVSDHYGRSKRDRAVAWVAEEGLDPRRTLFIGDTVHDFEVASACGADCILIAAGHQSEALLRATGAPVLRGLRGLMGYLS